MWPLHLFPAGCHRNPEGKLLGKPVDNYFFSERFRNFGSSFSLFFHFSTLVQVTSPMGQVFGQNDYISGLRDRFIKFSLCNEPRPSHVPLVLKMKSAPCHQGFPSWSRRLEMDLPNCLLIGSQTFPVRDLWAHSHGDKRWVGITNQLRLMSCAYPPFVHISEKDKTRLFDRWFWPITTYL